MRSFLRSASVIREEVRSLIDSPYASRLFTVKFKTRK